MFYARAMVTLCSMDNNIGLYANEIVYNPKMIVSMKELIKRGELPTPLLVWCGIAKGEENKISAWTDGMMGFGFDEIEIVKSDMKPFELQSIMWYLAEYCINNDVAYHDKDTISLKAGMKVNIEKSAGYNVNQDGDTLKIQIA